MFFITTFNAKLYEQFAFNFIKTYKDTNQVIPLICYIEEDYNYPVHENITYVDLNKAMPELLLFKKRNKEKIIDIDDEKNDNSQFLQNAVKFSHKVFAQAHASYRNEKFLFIDADNVFKKKIEENFINSFIPDDVFLTCYGRPNWVESGIVGFNSKKIEMNKIFFKIYLDYYLNDKIFKMRFKTDCQALDATREIMKKNSNYKEIDRGDGLDGHVILRDKVISVYLDHRKGKRKFEKLENVKDMTNIDFESEISFFSKIKLKVKNYLFKKFY